MTEPDDLWAVGTGEDGAVTIEQGEDCVAIGHDEVTRVTSAMWERRLGLPPWASDFVRRIGGTFTIGLAKLAFVAGVGLGALLVAVAYFLTGIFSLIAAFAIVAIVLLGTANVVRGDLDA